MCECERVRALSKASFAAGERRTCRMELEESEIVAMCVCVSVCVFLTLSPSHITINNELKWNLRRDETRLEL